MSWRTVHLTFDFEECDLPREGGVDFSLARGMSVSVEGANAVLDVLARAGVKGTFFCTLTFAAHASEIMSRLVAEGHEIAAHGVDHFHPAPDDPVRSREGLARLTGAEIAGYRQPRMFPVEDAALKTAGYRYNSSLNPAFIPGRYMHLKTPRRPFRRGGLLQIPASVTPFIRFPLFWLSLHLLPAWFYGALARRTLCHDGALVLYFHPWEFSASFAAKARALGVSSLIRRNLGAPMIARLEDLIRRLKAGDGVRFAPLREMTEGELT